MADLSGINLAMQTPFTADGGIDYVRWEELIELYIDAGVHGLVLGSGTGQHPYLSEEECQQLYRLGAKRIDGRVNLICQTSALNLQELLRRSQFAQDLGADALMILPPYLEGPADDDGLFEFYREIDRHLSTDIVGYNIPAATQVAISPALYKRLIELPNFNYIKDSDGDLCTQQEYVAAGGKVLNGADPITVYALMAGAVGSIWGGANFMPREAVKLFELVSGGDLHGALALWQKMVPAMIYLWTHDYMPAAIEASHMRGYGGGVPRFPLRPLDDAAKAELAAALAPLDA